MLNESSLVYGALDCVRCCHYSMCKNIDSNCFLVFDNRLWLFTNMKEFAKICAEFPKESR